MSKRIHIRPGSFEVAQRVEASEKATELGAGLRMEVHSAHTEFYADETVALGKVAVYCSQRYKEWPTYETTLDAPEEPWVPFAWRTADEG
ncbi:hypothetical protein ECC01_21725 [Bacillus tequilensis]|nr:hypothetical protein [Bacillus tequilensis]